jgi:parallel beta-helix repeat protein
MQDHDSTSPNLPTDRRALLAGIGGLAAGALLAGRAQAGPLTPPPGPITPTPGPEPRTAIDQINTPGNATAVFRITQPGSYYLTGNLSIPTGLVGIEITVGDVTLDLNGFQIAGFLNTSSHGISVTSAILRRNITVRNGTVVQCGGSGVDLATSIASVVEQLRVTNNTGDGIRTGGNSRVSDCTVGNNGGKGIFTGPNAIVQNCISVSNTGVDIETGSITPGSEPRIPIGPGTTPGDANHTYRITQPGSYYLDRNLIGESGKSGILIAASGVMLDLMGFELIGLPGPSAAIRTNSTGLTNLTILNGSIRNWGSNGINLSTFPAESGRIEGVHASGNMGAGVRAGQNFVVMNCTARNNSVDGITAGSGSVLTSCVSRDNGGSGIVIFNSVVHACASYSNGGAGIEVSSSTVTGCTANSNSIHGILSSGRSLIAGNTCSSNSGASGILASGAGNRVEDNHCTSNATGISVSSSGNFIARNTCSGNTVNWDIVAGNSYVIVQATTTASNFTGDAGGGGVGSTNPHANFTF